jgi:hypothetical protein
VSHTWQKLSSDRFDVDFIERRRVGLENFLLRVASHAQLCQEKLFLAFLKQEDGWKDSVYATDFQTKVRVVVLGGGASWVKTSMSAGSWVLFPKQART